jgi:DNA repair protein RecN (Recombination protein N)
MLAISASLAMADGMPVIVYDEVDSGVGGRLGAVIGAKLARLAQGRSVIAVTHTPQLAAHGTTHYRVVKAQGDETTMVTVQRLSHKERLDEVADMLGGGEEACGQARKLLRHALDVGQCRSGGAANVSVR